MTATQELARTAPAALVDGAGPPEADAVRAKFVAARKELNAALIERSQEVELVLTAMVAGEHALLVGPPGTAKSLLMDSVLRWAAGCKGFSILMTKFTEPDEVFGPIDVKGMVELGSYRRVVADMLPEAHFAFMDEVFKSNSAILNAMLKVMEERLYNPGGGWVRCPLITMLGASNEWPGGFDGGKELGALFDRFLFRKTVKPIRTEAGRRKLTRTPRAQLRPRFSTRVTPAEIAAAQADAAALPVSAPAWDAFDETLRDLVKEGVRPGDRRTLKAVGAARAAAWLDGAPEVQPEHLEVLAHVLWDDPAEQPQKAAEVVAARANPTGQQLNRLLAEAQEVVDKCDTRDLAQSSTAAAKLSEIDRKLAGMGKTPAVEAARAEIQRQSRELKIKAIDGI
jgi:MoxR-like ATPase